MWINQGVASHKIISCNIHNNKEKGLFELWATRPNGMSFNIIQSKDKKVVEEYKDAIDFGIENGECMLNLKEG